MSLPLPVSLSPSKVASFKDCALAFRFAAIDRVPEPPTPWAAKGTLVHRALELLMCEAPASRTPERAHAALDHACPEVLAGEEYASLALQHDDAFLADSHSLIDRYFRIEDPRAVRPIGLELMMDVRVGSLRLRGIIDRLELDADGELVVTDYKTGKVPSVSHEQTKLGGVHFYAFLCEQVLGRRPARVQLMYLSEPLLIITEPTDQSIRGLRMRTGAIWTAVERACEREDFRPKPSRLCEWCSFREWCPAFGGDPSAAPARARRSDDDTSPATPSVELLEGATASAFAAQAAGAAAQAVDLASAERPLEVPVR